MEIIQLAKVLKALSHPNRLELFFEIAKKRESSFEDCACRMTEIMEKLNVGAPTVSHHLKELTNANLITTERQGKNVVARINMETVNEIIQTLSLQCK
jgi:ArsR family transcriptional regulator, arsenate/arsenite/antimonite-responsive transcriptional repressor